MKPVKLPVSPPSVGEEKMNMTHRRIVVTAFLFLLFPFLSHAATLSELQAQIQALMARVAALQAQQGSMQTAAPQSGAAPSVSCPNLVRNLSRGSRGTDVAQLQQLLISQNLLAADSATGFFGALTEAAVKQWQAKNGIASSGTPATTGYGAVGPRTRTKIATACTAPSATPPQLPSQSSPSTPQTPQPPPTNNNTSPAPTISTTQSPQTCAPLPPETRTQSCPANQTGSITETRTSTCAPGATSPAWGQWRTTNNACTSKQLAISRNFSTGVNYHSVSDAFDATNPGPFIRTYDKPEVRAKVRAQLQGMADAGADVVKTGLWLTDSPDVRFPQLWRLAFPPTAQELANIRQYTEDVAATRAADGHQPTLELTLNWLGCAAVSKTHPTFPECPPTWDAFVASAKQSIDGIVQSVDDVRRSDGALAVSKMYFVGELMIGLGQNEDRFLLDLYPYFTQKVAAAGITPSLYFIIAADQSEILDNAYVDTYYPAINGHRSLFWLYRSIAFMREHNLPVSDELDFSFYPNSTGASYATLVTRVLDDLRAVFPGKKAGVVETSYFPDVERRNELGEAFAQEAASHDTLKKVIFWTTPDSGGYGVHAGYPFDFSAFATAAHVTVTPSSCVAGANGLCTAHIKWTSSDQLTQYWVQMDSQPPVLMGCDTKKVSEGDVGWIQAGHSYLFTAYDAIDCSESGRHGAVLVSTTLRGI